MKTSYSTVAAKAIVTLILVIGALRSVAQSSFPVPDPDPRRLFYLQRTPNRNTVVYELNYSDKGLDREKPVHVYWIRYEEKGQRTELNFIQRKFAYGVKAHLLPDSTYKVNLVSYSGYSMFLRRDNNNRYGIYAPVNSKMALLTRIFVKINGGTFWSPNVEYFEVSGVDPDTGRAVTERKKILK